ncbi:c-type cytochrome domain-containing protein [Paraglaciecola sp. L3A3]|uniref:c-type cytochrome domain-containing protein n=1 Tax=Paraglaciecola sp. L3A3 TaxID=2686358 RepID=UPI00131E3928|nr:c-type cytochrome domain-containing protein [Paraglaciecola sp. L3A3]
MDIIQFFGRFHVLVLHLPVGILMLAALLEIYTSIKQNQRNPLLNVIWFWGAISAIAACVLGWMLSQGEGYSVDAVFIHRTFGILTAVTAIIAFVYFTFVKSHLKTVVWILSIGQLFLLFSTGHYGANMTHGETYLVDKAPNIVRTILGFEKHAIPRGKITSLEQADVYLDVIEPMLQQRCVSCHNDSKQKGKLNLSNINGLLKGGKSGKAIVANDLNQSELYQRITMDHEKKGFMPAEGKTPLTDEQTRAIAWWIQTGAPTEGNVTEFTIAKQDKEILNKLFGLSSNGFNLVPIEPITAEQEQALEDTGFIIKRLSQTNHYLDLDLSVKRQPLTDPAIQALLAVKEHVVSLNLRNNQVTDEQLPEIAKLTNLLRLRLERNKISSSGVSALSSLSKLSYLNLYKSNVDDSVLPILNTFNALEKVYIGETNVTAEQINEFSKKSKITVQGIAPVPTSTPNKEA